MTKEQQRIRTRLCNIDFRKVLQESIKELSNKYKTLIRAEPVLTSLDEKKQLRMPIASIVNPSRHEEKYIVMRDVGREMFDIDELIFLCKKIQKELEKYLHYGIDTFICIKVVDDYE